MRHLTAPGSDEQQEFMARQVALTSALRNAFESLGTSAPLDLLDCLMPWRAGGKGEDWAQWSEIRHALAEMDTQLMELVPGDRDRGESVRAWWRLQIERQVLAFRREAQWRLLGSNPDLSSYLAVSTRSIGVEWIAAALIAFDPDAEVPGPHSMLWTAIDAIARAIRLANDLHDSEQEGQQRKARWVIIRERELLRGSAAPEAAEARARAELQEASTTQIAQARELINGVTRAGGSATLRAGLEGLLGIGLETCAPVRELIPA